MDLVQSRIVADDVERLAAFYARLVRVSVVLNDYYVEVPTGAASAGFSRRRSTDYREDQAARLCSPQHQAEIMLDFRAGDVDAEIQADQPAGSHLGDAARHAAEWCRTMIFRDPAGNLANVSSPAKAAPG